VTPRRWWAIAAGMGGVLIILHPWSKGFVSFTAAAAAAAATVFYSLSALTVRSLSRSNSNIGTIFWNFVLVGFGSGALAVIDWHPVPPAEWPWLAAVGIAGGLGQYWITDAFRRAPPSAVGPFEYTSLLWAFALDWIFWSASPSASLLAGAAVVVACGTYVIWDEHRSAHLALVTANPPP
jgi:drug/metabolite transporter (DMT)-like permease